MLSKPLDTIVYIDGFNFYHSLKNTPYKWLNIEALISSVLDSSWHNVIKIKYFTAKTPFSESAQRQDLYFRAISTLQKIEIIYGKFKRRHIQIKKNYVDVWLQEKRIYCIKLRKQRRSYGRNTTWKH